LGLFKKFKTEKENSDTIQKNHCAGCQKKLGLIRYNPPKGSNVIGQLCKDCFNNPPEISIPIKTSDNPEKVCTSCNENLYNFEFHSMNICSTCFSKKFGKIKKRESIAEYFGGHKAFLAGGLITDSQSGRLILTDSHLIFSKGDKNNEKRWDIIIPLKSVLLDNWNIKENSRRKTVSGGGLGVPVGGFALGGGVGFIDESGKSHRIVIGYVDENNIPQQPRFGISSFRGKAIKEWALLIYEQVVKNQTKQESEQVTSSDDSPLEILKMRLAQGEITLDEFEKLKKAVE